MYTVTVAHEPPLDQAPLEPKSAWPTESPRSQEASLKLDRWLFVIVTCIITMIAALMAFSYVAQFIENHSVVASLSDEASTDQVAITSILGYVSQDRAMRMSTFFLSFVLIYIGCLMCSGRALSPTDFRVLPAHSKERSKVPRPDWC